MEFIASGLNRKNCTTTLIEFQLAIDMIPIAFETGLIDKKENDKLSAMIREYEVKK